ncbi:bifunctional phosphatase PAP2/O-acyltransferase family protein [Amycolatopsis viridis]|uniref:Diacylglycerol O-acyltransferase n=1 Tax=Amycolatopsis viridis TaxID=185678 RepID=A0ABX0SSS6_9PSEU|nr:phosphatase PAP2 family protein [Amycolatopsis viridis]NIH80011.1 hypothetical protein [Amycolatopsis viridis]
MIYDGVLTVGFRSRSPVVPDARTAALRRPSWWGELLLGLAVFGVYLLVEALPLPDREARAQAGGEALLAFERMLHLDFELPVNQWLAGQGWLRVAANYEYAITYIVSALVLLIWVHARYPAHYRSVRTSFVWLNLFALACFWLFPVAPPRMLPGAGFVDTVRLGHTFLSWGSPALQGANQLAAMPSLHVGWALWVSVVLARISGGRVVQIVSAVHVLVTFAVIIATGNHYWIDAAGAAVLIAAATGLARVARPVDRVSASDTFFLHVETPAYPQHVGGLIMLNTSADPAGPAGDWVRAAIRDKLADLPRYTQRLSEYSPWRRQYWVPHPDLDWDWHVPEFDLTRPDGSPGGMGELHKLVARFQGELLPRDRPLWRFVVVRGVETNTAAVISLVHHAVADGIGTISLMLDLFDSPSLLDGLNDTKRPTVLQKVAAGAVGLAQLATDGRPKSQLPAGNPPDRRYATLQIPLDDVRELARRHRVRVTDLLLGGVAGALRRVAVAPLPESMLTSVTLMAAEPRPGAEGNVTAAVMVDIPLGDMPEAERLRRIAKATRRLRTGTRVVASRFVQHTVAGLLPAFVHAWFARTVYNARFFNGTVSNMPGASWQVSFRHFPLRTAFAIIPLAPGTPFTIGVLGWYGSFSLSATVDAALVDSVDEFLAGFRAVLAELD